MAEYLSRISDSVLQDRLEAKGAVLIEGAKWCGKTTTAKQTAGSVIRMDRPDRARAYHELAELDPLQLLAGDTPRLIDEWQLAPSLWNAVRYEVDERGEFGQFILTGSAVPPNLGDFAHTGTGRIARMRMRPMSLSESRDSTCEVSLKSLFQGEECVGECATSIEQLAFWICRGGWPRAIGVSDRVALRQAMDYFDAVVTQDVQRATGVARSSDRIARLLRSYARHIGTQAAIPTIQSDIANNQNDVVSIDTLNSYLDALRSIFVIEDSRAWNPNLRSKTAIRTSDTRYFVDPSIATAALGVGPKDLLNDLEAMGLLFENLCVRDLRVYADALDGQVYHYRDKSGLECDAVIHLRDGSYGLVEVKLGGETLIEEGVRTLKSLESKMDTTKMKPPAFMAVLCGVAQYAYRRKDGVLIIPLSCLTA